ncbi:hypothetical protein FS837_011627 [Tulasnella sp. UAMH 9824]|nr:hypothetical protein FS837_011627 [Tulasnella sp. UAMH 9824]
MITLETPNVFSAPLPPIAVLHLKPCNMVIIVTPPSPPAAMGPFEYFQSQTYAKGMGMNRDSSRPALHHPRLLNSALQALRGSAIVVKPSSGATLFPALQTRNASRCRLRSARAFFKADGPQTRRKSGRTKTRRSKRACQERSATIDV